MKRSLAVVLALTTSLVSVPALAGIEVGSKGLVFSSDDGETEFRIGGRAHYDSVWYDADITNIQDESKMRRLRIYLSGKLSNGWSFKVDRDVGGTSEGWKNVWVRYSGIEKTKITLGNQLAPFSLEDIGSSNKLKMIERSLANALTPGFYTGATYARYGQDWTVAGGYYVDPIDADEGKTNQGDGGFAGRVTMSPVREKRHTVHLGMSFETRKMDDAKPFTINPRPEIGIVTTRLVKTGNIANVDKTDAGAIEAAVGFGSVLLQTEYIAKVAEYTTGGDSKFTGWYMQGAWAVTGERQKYSRRSGKFRGIKSDRAMGAVELTARYSSIDLDDGPIAGGVQTNTTVGVNWYLNDNMRVSANYIWMDVDRILGPDEEPSALLTRLQLAF